MTYDEALNKVESFLKFGSKPGLERIKTLLNSIGNPQDTLRIVHVAGTNGKGSVCAMLSSVLTACGYKTGLFTSPHIMDFRERFQINNQMISKDKFIKLTEFFLPFIENSIVSRDPITEFEITAAMAFKFFKDENCDVVILEVGMGGRLDATNVIKNPILSVITSISLDHTDVLGNTIEKITTEKCGIIKPNCPVVVSPNQDKCVYEITSRTAEKLKSPVFFANKLKIENIEFSLENGTSFTYNGLKINIPLLGEHQIDNVATALKAVEVLSKYFDMTPKNIISGFKNIRLRVRFEVISKLPLIILDGAHNPGGAQVLANSIKKYLPNNNIIGIVGMLKDKDAKTALATVLPLCSEVITVSPKSDRALQSEELAVIAALYNKNVKNVKNLKLALNIANKISNDKSAIIIFGSFYLFQDLADISL